MDAEKTLRVLVVGTLAFSVWLLGYLIGFAHAFYRFEWVDKL